ncbi:hypothetical protein [Pseudanabaena sp. UWO310]|uniref:hypothetical protein n=1 Tax=Pseudanabaena sp. UWO310 TaxID=2480795 RepID=UPI00115C3C97|nr:hypothetical protein [Pseudanabaena sp. UWO310]TYQ26552.1 hypothetical protein PseudUWO310_17180 [Pseudanabaena sp. UWO310]
MPKFQLYIGIVATGMLVSCQPNLPQSPTSTSNPTTEKAISYLRSQLNLSSSMAIAVESQKSQSVNISDVCQTVAPNQDGLEITLIAENMRYILQTNRDASKIEVCRSEDAKPETTGKYTGAGYILRYPAEWKAIDLGLEPSGASTVIFTPSREIAMGEGSRDKTELVNKLQLNQQVYTIVSRQALDGKAIATDGEETAKDLVTIPFDAKVKGAKSGSRKEFTKKFTKELPAAIANSSNKQPTSTQWKVKVLTLETDKFVYRVCYYQPEAKESPDSPNAKVFDQFANSFSLIP